MTVAWSDDDRRAIYARGLTIRALAAAAFMAFFIGLWTFGPGSQIRMLPGLLYTLCALIAVNPVLWWIGRHRGFPLQDFVVHWIGDVLAVSVIVYCLGVLDIPLSAAAYMIMIISSATFATMARAMWLATWSSVCFVALVGGEEFGLIPHQHVEFGVHLGIEGKVFLVGASITFFYVFGYLGGTLATQLRNQTEEVFKQKRALETAYSKEQAAREGILLLSALVQHDVYGPLGVISGACKEAAISCQNEDFGTASKFIGMIDERLQSLESAVKTLGLFGDDEVAKAERYCLREVAEELVSDLAAECSERDVEVRISGQWPLVRIRRERVYHVLRNLLTNSVKSVDDDGSGCVTITAGRYGVDEGGCRISVSDNGPGVSDEVRQRLLEADVRRLGPRRIGGGYGAGLGLSRNLISSWGGSLDYSPNQGGGSVFSVSIPPSLIEGWV